MSCVRKQVGWMYRTEGPAYIITKAQICVEIMKGPTKIKATFSDNEEGGREAASWTTSALKCEDWELEKTALGFVIMVAKEVGQ